MTHADLKEMYELYFPKVYNHVYFKVLSKDTADDLTAEVFLKVVRSIDRYDETKSAFKTWVYTITGNTLIDYYRARKNDVPLEMADIPEQSGDGHAALLKSEERRALHKALAALDDRTREIISLRYNAEMSIREIAKMLEMNESTASTIHTRGLAKLRKILKDDFFAF